MSIRPILNSLFLLCFKQKRYLTENSLKKCPHALGSCFCSSLGMCPAVSDILPGFQSICCKMPAANVSVT